MEIMNQALCNWLCIYSFEIRVPHFLQARHHMQSLPCIVFGVIALKDNSKTPNVLLYTGVIAALTSIYKSRYRKSRLKIISTFSRTISYLTKVAFLSFFCQFTFHFGYCLKIIVFLAAQVLFLSTSHVAF